VQSSSRDRRFIPEPAATSRTEGQRDRDRILYAPLFRRLAEVTQVVSPVNGYVFHNRLTHTLEVAQIGRRIAENLLREPGAKTARVIGELGGLDPDVVEAAALLHDLGHPPFGHLAEQELQRLLRLSGDTEGFEGNAQSVRIVTRLEVQSELFAGLNLTRATINASLKYPWTRSQRPAERKWGAYETESAYLSFAREDQPQSAFAQGLVGQLS
jgi:dGTPase